MSSIQLPVSTQLYQLDFQAIFSSVDQQHPLKDPTNELLRFVTLVEWGDG